MITEGLLRIGAQIVLSKVADNVLSELSSSGDTQSSNLNLLSSDDSGDLATSIFTNFLSETLDTGASDSFGSSGKYFNEYYRELRLNGYNQYPNNKSYI